MKPNQSYRWLGTGIIITGLWAMVKGIDMFWSPWFDALPFISMVIFVKSWMSLAGIIRLLPKEEQIRIGFAISQDFEPEVSV